MTDLRLRLPGWRSLLEGSCERCEHRLLQDLPAGHGLLYPATLDLDTGETFGAPGIDWFSDSLAQAWLRPDTAPVALDAEEVPEEGVLLNCLDRVYGHSVLKLLNATADGSERLIVLVPESLLPLVPDRVAATWVVREPTARFAGWLSDLDEGLRARLGAMHRCELSPAYPHPHPSTYDVSRLAPGVAAAPRGDPTVLFSLRGDRPWGGSAAEQAANVRATVDRLAELFPGVAAVAMGTADGEELPGVEDLRAPEAPGAERERAWLAAMRGADLAIGTHGSHMLLASAFARAAIELVPRSRFGNYLQATVLADTDPVLGLAFHRAVWSATDDMAEVTPDVVAHLAATMIGDAERTRGLFTGPAAGQGPGPIPDLRRVSPVAPPAPAVRIAPLGERVRGRLGRLRERVASRGEDAPPSAEAPTPPAVLTDRSGARFELETAEEIDAFVRHEGHFERAELELVEAFLEPGAVAVDVGANIGHFTVTMARAVGGAGRVHAFEPSAESARRLRRSLELNGRENVTVNEAALAAEAGTRVLYGYGPGTASWSTLAPRQIPGTAEAARQAEVAAETLDDYAERTGIERIDVLKIDVEGGELDVLRGAERLFAARAVALVLVEVSDETLPAFGARAHALLGWLEERGMRPHVIEDGRLRGFRVAGPFHELANVVAFGAAARERLAGTGLVGLR